MGELEFFSAAGPDVPVRSVCHGKADAAGDTVFTIRPGEQGIQEGLPGTGFLKEADQQAQQEYGFTSGLPEDQAAV
jgi:hypothetical protein